MIGVRVSCYNIVKLCYPKPVYHSFNVVRRLFYTRIDENILPCIGNKLAVALPDINVPYHKISVLFDKVADYSRRLFRLSLFKIRTVSERRYKKYYNYQRRERQPTVKKPP